MNGSPRRTAKGCDELSVEPAFSFQDVTIQSCSVDPTSATPDTTIAVTATARNDNDVPAIFDIGWFARDLPNSPGVARFNGGILNPNSTGTLQEFFVPNQVPEIIDTVGEDAEWTSFIEAVLIPGTIQPASGSGAAPHGFGLSAHSRATSAPAIVRADGGCTSCGSPRTSSLARRVDRGTLAVAATGIGTGVAAALLAR